MTLSWSGSNAIKEQRTPGGKERGVGRGRDQSWKALRVRPRSPVPVCGGLCQGQKLCQKHRSPCWPSQQRRLRGSGGRTVAAITPPCSRGSTGLAWLSVPGKLAAHEWVRGDDESSTTPPHQWHHLRSHLKHRPGYTPLILEIPSVEARNCWGTRSRVKDLRYYVLRVRVISQARDRQT